MLVFLRHINDVVVDFVNAPGAREALDAFEFLQGAGHVTALEDDYIRLVPLQFDDTGHRIIQLSLDPTGTLQLCKRLRHAIMPNGCGIDWQGQDKGRDPADKRIPPGAQSWLQGVTGQLQTEIAIVGRVIGNPW
ncbi:hypothetical protein D3C76_1399640 [compost metagenome]